MIISYHCSNSSVLRFVVHRLYEVWYIIRPLIRLNGLFHIRQAEGLSDIVQN